MTTERLLLGRSPRMGAGALLAALLLAGCSGGGGGGAGASSTGSVSSAVTPTTAFVQDRFVTDHAANLFAAFKTGIPPEYAVDPTSTEAIDLSAPGLELDEHLRFGKDHGMLGYYAADFTTKDSEEFFGLTTQVFRALDGPPAMWAKFGNYEKVTIDDATLTQQVEADYQQGRVGHLWVDVYEDADGAHTFAMRASLVDNQALHHVVAIVDAPPGENYDGFGALRRALGSIDGVLRKV